MNMNVLELSGRIIAGKRLCRQDDLHFFQTCDLADLCKGADAIRAHYCGNKVDLCTIINGRSGRCSEDCKYCAQSAHHHTECDVYGFLDIDTILKAALANEKEGVNRFSIVTSGRTLDGEDFEKAILAYKKMHQECHISLCASHGFLSSEQFQRLHDAGVQRYHSNIETSRSRFPSICTTHTFEEKLENIRRAKAAGLSVCSGGIIGMGETLQDRIDMALTLAELDIRSIPINVLTPIPGTPLEHLKQLSAEDILRTVAIFRYLNPEANIRLAAGRSLLPQNGMIAFQSGASATITGNMLTTSGSTIQSDKEMFAALGRDIVPEYGRQASPKKYIL